MKKNRKIIIVMVAIAFAQLSACENSSNTSSNLDSQSPNSNSTQKADEDSPHTTENASGSNNIESNDQVDHSARAAETEGESVDKNDITESKKEEYLKKLHEIEKELQTKQEATTQLDMEQMETEQYRIWDDALNEIYGVLMEQLSSNQMAELREEQRNWITQRDEAARSESSQFEGGSMESLTYVSTQARMTKERCFELVEDYMR